MDVDKILLYFKEVDSRIDNFKKELEEFYKDTRVDLDDRWETFVRLKNYPKLYNYDSCYYNFECLPLELARNFSWYDDFYSDRYETVNMIDKVISMINEVTLDPPGKENAKDVMQFLRRNIHLVKEEILSKNLLSFQNDW